MTLGNAENEKKFLILWKNGDKVVAYGETFAKSLISIGCGISELSKIYKYVVNGDPESYLYNHDLSTWEPYRKTDRG